MFHSGGYTHDSRRCRQNSAMAKKNIEGVEETLECMCCGELLEFVIIIEGFL